MTPEQQKQIDDYKMNRANSGRPVLNEDDADLKEYLLKVMGVPAGDQPRHNDRGQKGTIIPMRFIQPSLVSYSDVGTVLVEKPALDKMLASFNGRPVFNEKHKDVGGDDFSIGRADGIVTNARYNSEDGWYWADVMVWDEDTKANCKNGYSLSCAYDVKKWGPGGIHNNIPYDREVLEGEYTHLAIVPNPRYEGARIIYNNGGLMKLKFWEKEKVGEAAREVELANANVTINGKDMPFSVVADLVEKEEKRKADELANAKKLLNDDDTVEIAGRKMTVKEAKDLAAIALKNADDEEAKKKEKENADDEEKKKKADEERKNAEEKEKKEKDEKKNAEDHEKGDHKDKEMDNCAQCKNQRKNANEKHFDDLRELANRRGDNGRFEAPNLKSLEDKVVEGVKRYGPKN